MNDELALLIGHHILEQYNKWTENPAGKAINIPIMLPHSFGQPDWAMTVECGMPWFIERYWENGEYKTKHWSLKEWFNSRKPID